MEEKEKTSDDLEIDLKELFFVIWKAKLIVAGCAILSAVFSVGYSLSLPNLYQSVAILSAKQGSGVSELGQLAGQYGGLASMAGINIPFGDSLNKSQLAQAKMKTLEFFTLYLYDEILLELMAFKEWNGQTNEIIWDETAYDHKGSNWIRKVAWPMHPKPSPQEAYKVFQGVFSVSEDKLTNLVTLSITHQSPNIAYSWLENIVKSINEDYRSKDIKETEQSIIFLKEQQKNMNIVSIDEVFSRLIEDRIKTMILAEVSEDYVFDVIQPAYVPENKVSPRRSIICIVGTLLGGFVGILIGLLVHYGKKIRPVID